VSEALFVGALQYFSSNSTKELNMRKTVICQW